MNVASIMIMCVIIAGSTWAICVLLDSIKDDIIGLIELLREMKKEDKNDAKRSK